MACFSRLDSYWYWHLLSDARTTLLHMPHKHGNQISAQDYLVYLRIIWWNYTKYIQISRISGAVYLSRRFWLVHHPHTDYGSSHCTEYIPWGKMSPEPLKKLEKNNTHELQGSGLTERIGQEVEDPCSNPDPTRHVFMSCSWDTNNVNMQHTTQTQRKADIHRSAKWIFTFLTGIGTIKEHIFRWTINMCAYFGLAIIRTDYWEQTFLWGHFDQSL